MGRQKAADNNKRPPTLSTRASSRMMDNGATYSGQWVPLRWWRGYRWRPLVLEWTQTPCGLEWAPPTGRNSTCLVWGTPNNIYRNTIIRLGVKNKVLMRKGGNQGRPIIWTDAEGMQLLKHENHNVSYNVCRVIKRAHTSKSLRGMETMSLMNVLRALSKASSP